SGHYAAIEAVIGPLLLPFVLHFVLARRRWLVAECERKSAGIQLAQEQRESATCQIHLRSKRSRDDFELGPRHDRIRLFYRLTIYAPEEQPGDMMLGSNLKQRFALADLIRF